MADTLTCSRNELAVALDVTPKHIDNLFNAGVVVKQARGEYDVIQSCKNYVKFLRGTNTSEKLDLTQERTRLTKFQADLALIQLQQARREYWPVALVSRWISTLMTSIRSMLMAISSTIAVDLPHLEKSDIITITDLVRDALEQASKIPIPRDLKKAIDTHLKIEGE